MTEPTRRSTTKSHRTSCDHQGTLEQTKVQWHNSWTV